MTDPVRREQKKYRMQQMARQWALIGRIVFWLPIVFFGAVGLLMAIFGRH